MLKKQEGSAFDLAGKLHNFLNIKLDLLNKIRCEGSNFDQNQFFVFNSNLLTLKNIKNQVSIYIFTDYIVNVALNYL